MRRFVRCCLGLVVAAALASCQSEPPRAAKSPAAVRVLPEPERQAMPPLAVLQRLRGSEDARRSCFEISGARSQGFVKLAWQISTEGRVSDVAVEGTSVHDEAIERCLADEVAKLDFGPRQEPMQARWTFVHELPQMPGVAKPGRKKQRRRQAAAKDEVRGVSIEDSSPGTLELGRIEDIVHAGFPLFAYCYRAALERDASTSGVVRLRFVIDEEGSVMGVMDSGSEFGDKVALDCMAEGIFALSFPPPSGGDVRVQYRIVFESG